jgi:acyl-CoA thioesterase
VSVGVETVRAGRRYATVEGRLRQDGRELLRVLGAFGDLDAQEGPTRLGAGMPALPPPEDCVSVLDISDYGGGRRVPEIMHRYDLRLDPGCQWVRTRVAHVDPASAPAGTGAGAPSTGRRADGDLHPLEVAGWIRFADGAPPSIVGLLAMADAFPPTLVGSVAVGWVPTVELTVHVRGRPAPGWVLGVARTRFLIDGLLEQDGELWDSAGRLVALARQLALVLPRR